MYFKQNLPLQIVPLFSCTILLLFLGVDSISLFSGIFIFNEFTKGYEVIKNQTIKKIFPTTNLKSHV